MHTSSSTVRTARRLVVVIGIALFVSPLHARADEWKKNTTVDGIAYDKVKIEADGKVIGYLAADTEIRERPCARDWVHLHPNGELSLFRLQRELALPVLKLPANTWAFQNESGIVTGCAFPNDTEIQGQLCRGTGGSKGAQVTFYESGRLKKFFAAKPTRIDGVLCDTGLARGLIELHENGRLKSCLLAEDLKRENRTFTKGTRVWFDAAGKTQSE
jgi:hypothetical protein